MILRRDAVDFTAALALGALVGAGVALAVKWARRETASTD
jgi:hypothetical protein